MYLFFNKLFLKLFYSFIKQFFKRMNFKPLYLLITTQICFPIPLP